MSGRSSVEMRDRLSSVQLGRSIRCPSRHRFLAPTTAWVLTVGLTAAVSLAPQAAFPLPPAITAPPATPSLPRGLAGLDAIAAEVLRRTGVPGMAIAVVEGDQVRYLKGFGRRRVTDPAAVDPDTVFQLASVSKPIATTVIASLVGEGRLQWDDPVRRYLPEFRIGPAAVADSVTLRDLLSHRSGLPDHAGDRLEDLGFDRPAVLERLRHIPIDNRFRAGFAYTNFGFTAAAEAAARAEGRSWEELSAERLYRPLGMSRTSSRHGDWLREPNRAPLHVRSDGRWQALHERDPDAQAPAGGVSASVRDVARWMGLQLAGGHHRGRPLVPAEALAETHRPQVVSRAPKDPAREQAGLYGLGWNVGHDDRGRVQLGHSGAFSLGAATTVTLLPAEGLGIAVLTNGEPLGAPEAVVLSFLDLVHTGAVRKDHLAELGPVIAAAATTSDPSPIKVPAVPLPPGPLASYAGSYRNAYLGRATVRASDDGLVLELGPAGLSFPLRHISGDSFSYVPPGENGGTPSAVEFRRDGRGAAAAMRLANFAAVGQDLLRREQAGP